jgi:hypothetical protein
MAEKLYANSFANPNNAIKLSQGVNCGCGTDQDCQASYTYVFSLGGSTLTTTDASFLLSGDGIVTTTGISVTVQDQSGNSANNTGDDTAAIVVDTSGLTNTDAYYRVDYEITTDDGCTSTVTLFLDPNKAADATGSPDPYNAER